MKNLHGCNRDALIASQLLDLDHYLLDEFLWVHLAGIGQSYLIEDEMDHDIYEGENLSLFVRERLLES